jgi:hypothetical protein
MSKIYNVLNKNKQLSKIKRIKNKKARLFYYRKLVKKIITCFRYNAFKNYMLKKENDNLSNSEIVLKEKYEKTKNIHNFFHSNIQNRVLDAEENLDHSNITYLSNSNNDENKKRELKIFDNYKFTNKEQMSIKDLFARNDLNLENDFYEEKNLIDEELINIDNLIEKLAKKYNTNIKSIFNLFRIQREFT